MKNHFRSVSEKYQHRPCRMNNFPPWNHFASAHYRYERERFSANIFSITFYLCRLFLQSPANPDLLYIIFFCHTQLTVTLLLALIFGSKVGILGRNEMQRTKKRVPLWKWMMFRGAWKSLRRHFYGFAPATGASFTLTSLALSDGERKIFSQSYRI